MQKELYLLIHNIRSVHNVGSIFRTADAAGISKIYLSGYTPAPIDRFGRIRPDMGKVSLGAENSVKWEVVKESSESSILDFISNLKKDGVKIIALEQNEKSIDYKKMKVGERTLLVLGSEVDGVDSSLLDLCDSIIEIPMRGEKESLNVSVAAGIAMYEILS